MFSRLLRLAHEFLAVLAVLMKPVTSGVKLLLIKDDQILLVKHVYTTGWHLPGGGMKRGEDVETATRREAAEELGASLGKLRLFGIYTREINKNGQIIVVYCSDFSLSGDSDYEIESYQFFPLKSLPADATIATIRRVDEYNTTGLSPNLGNW